MRNGTPIAQKEELQEELLVDDLTGMENQIILFNDDVNTFDYVIECLVDICDHDPLQAEQCALITHFKGKSIVKTGSIDELEPMCTGLCDRGLSAELD